MYQNITSQDISDSLARLVPIVRACGPTDSATTALAIAHCINESRGNASAHNRSGATGLGQLKPPTATDVIRAMYSEMTPKQQRIIAEVMGPRLQPTLEMKWMNQKLPSNGNTGITVNTFDLFNPQFNFILTYYHIRQIARWIKISDLFKYRSVIAAIYFQGYGFYLRYFKSSPEVSGLSLVSDDIRGYARNVSELSTIVHPLIATVGSKQKVDTLLT